MAESKLIITTTSGEVGKKLRQLAAQIKDRRPAAKQLAVQLLGDAQRNFESDGALFGNKWPPLAESTERYKTRRGVYKMLVGAYGRVKRTKTGKVKTRASKRIFDAKTGKAARIIVGAKAGGNLRGNFYQKSTADYAAVGNETPYASFHDQGTGRLPRRQLLPSKQWATDRGIVIFREFIEAKKKEAGL